MAPVEIMLLLAVCFLAYSNGANDNFKGVASLFGSGRASYRVALGWATVTTFAGSLAAIVLAQALLKKFSGKGLVPDALVGAPFFLFAVALAAGATVILATRLGFPISTTHALTGAMLGSGWVAAGSQVHLGVLGAGFVLPLLVSPLLAVLLGGILYFILRAGRRRLGITKEWCVCVGAEQRVVATSGTCGGAFAMKQTAPLITGTVDSLENCEARYTGRLFGVRGQSLVDAGHFLSAGVVSFARGLNDTPKIAALLLVLPSIGSRAGLIAVAVAMAVGGLLGARRIAMTMSKKITPLNAGQGFSANLATGLLVTSATFAGLPVSTTHVSVGALSGIGLITGQADRRVIRNILLSWVVTLPCAAAIGAVICWLAER